MKSELIAAVCLIVLSATSCGIQKDTSSPVMLRNKEWTISGVEYDNRDFSGLAFTADGARMVAVFNSAGVYWLDIPRDGDTRLHLEPLCAAGYQYKKEKRDIEAVTVDKKTGDIYFGQERPSSSFAGRTIYRLRYPSFDKEEIVHSFDEATVPDGNNGIEGLSWLKKGKLIVGREGGGKKDIAPMMIFYSEKKGVLRMIRPDREIKQIAELVYDDVRKCIWILDGDYDRMLYRCNLDGKILDRYPLPYIANAEALLIDRSRKCIWIGSDETPSKLYKISFENL